ncbi:hypothetical protein BGZ70_000284 [Mortierella alpina]|uniref:BTB domain-containing protein n=1 Tax=Mortierella alpina TaxID=64518 RepID=A0A9P6JFN4_MORAP|nr:hypothetical protein BGZ70_000284 [Mortierella alpina]
MFSLPDVYKNLLEADEGDVLIKLKDGKQIRVISFLIKQRSPVFKSMLDASMQESSTGVVDLSTQYTHEAFREFLAFLYYNRLHTGSYVPLLFEILCIADYFGVDAYSAYTSNQIIALIQSVPICLTIATETRKHGALADVVYNRCLGFLVYALGECYDKYSGDSKPWCCSGHTTKSKGIHDSSVYTVDGQIACIIPLVVAGKLREPDASRYTRTPGDMLQLSDLYKELLAAGEGDIVVKFKGGKQLKVISYLIKNRSPVFRSMLNASMQETSTGVVDLSSHYTLEAFEELLAFLYYNRLYIGCYEPLLFELLCIADYFAVDAYRTYISDRIIALIQNVTISLVIAPETRKHGAFADPWCCSGHTTKSMGVQDSNVYTVDGHVACTHDDMLELSDLYKKLLAAGEGDIVVKLKGGKQLKVISYLMKKRSPVFKSMLDASMRETSTGVVDLSSHYTLEAFKEFMAFLYYNKFYTGCYVPLLFEILRIADYFAVDAYRGFLVYALGECYDSYSGD